MLLMISEDSQEEALMFAKAAKSVLETHHDLRCSTIFFSEASGALKSFLDIRRKYWCITMVVLSDDVAFLAALAERSLVMTSSRLIALTRLPAQTFLENEKLRTTFSTMNAVIGIFYEKSKRFTMYYLEPYSNTEDEVTRAAHWSLKEGLVQASRLPLFYDKFIRFKRRPTLKIATEAFHSRQTQKDGRNTDHTADYFAQGINFNYRYEHIPDGTFGSKQDDGSCLSPSRVEIVDFTSPISIQYSVILGGRGLPQVDPWAFLFPLGPFVCAAILAALVVVPLIMVLLFTCASFSFPNPARFTWPANLFEMIRVLLLQDNKIPGGAWWWRRLAMGGWMLTALVLIKSYAGNLMSVLTVRYVQQPYQSLSDVVRDPSVSMIWQTNTSNVQFIRSAETGIYRELAEAEKNGRTKFQPIMNFFWSLDKLVRRRDHVLIDVEIMIMLMIGHDFTFTGG
ncbi:Glutamate receptor ionotropic, delta-2 [Portunus trituberculatus]|uniref:Glutamate receptor ionotropic, delta-2 n=1 Tax=Portunus trituberculatus TaxID=210409 RepID=A0A5B7D6F8_PORTR|nr:Glutamate receptor ionotropic, delta-2 [Portunus trituberculatus]